MARKCGRFKNIAIAYIAVWDEQTYTARTNLICPDPKDIARA